MSLLVHCASRLIPALLLLAWCFPALAQNSVRGPSQPPVPMQILEREGRDVAGKAGENATAQSGAAQPKFPNKDTAKNRQDYEMGTDQGADLIQIGRDEATGESVMRATPPKKAQQKQPFEDQPIIVQPRIRR